MAKQLVLQSCFFMYCRGILIERQRKGLIVLMNALPDVYICSLRKKRSPVLPQGIIKYTLLVAKQTNRGF